MFQRPTILLYHGVPANADIHGFDAAAFARQMRLIRRWCIPTTPEDAVRRRTTARRRVLVTFDDGFRNNAEVAAPILQELEIPAVFFVTSRHTVPGRYLWFVYLRALERWYPGTELAWRDRTFDMRPSPRSASIRTLTDCLLDLPDHPASMYAAIESELPPLESFVPAAHLRDSCEGMSPSQVRMLGESPLFRIGVHTVDHPFLTRCSPDESLRQLRINKEWIEAITGRRCASVAYPSGDYSALTLQQCAMSGLEEGHAVEPRVGAIPSLELPRLGVYSPSVAGLAVKLLGGLLLRRMGLRVG